MRRIVLKAVLRLGRYAILPIVALTCAMFMVWLMAIDRYTILALAAAPIVLSAAPAAIALALGLVLLPSRRDRNLKVDEAAAPGLWVIWKELDRAFTRAGRTLLIDANFNASIREESRYAGLFKQHITMTVGLPLLIILDERAIRAVIAHEVAHARLQHASGGTNLFDFIAASENVSTTRTQIGPSRGVSPMLSFILCLNGWRRNTAHCRVKMSFALMRTQQNRSDATRSRAHWCWWKPAARVSPISCSPLWTKSWWARSKRRRRLFNGFSISWEISGRPSRWRLLRSSV